MQHQAFEQFASTITERLRAESPVLALIALGSFADEVLWHAASDHDFWVVTEPGAQNAFREGASWLPEPDSQLTTVRFPNRGASVLYRDRHLVEYAVFSLDELTHQVTDRYRVIFDRADVTTSLPTLLAKTREKRREVVAWPDAVANLGVLVWTGWQRYHQGERLSSHKYLRFIAPSAVLDLAQAAHLLEGASLNVLDPWRRTETLQPQLAAELWEQLHLPLPAAAVGLLDLARKHISPHLSDQRWDVIDTVRVWITSGRE